MKVQLRKYSMKTLVWRLIVLLLCMPSELRNISAVISRKMSSSQPKTSISGTYHVDPGLPDSHHMPTKVLDIWRLSCCFRMGLTLDDLIRTSIRPAPVEINNLSLISKPPSIKNTYCNQFWNSFRNSVKQKKAQCLH